MSLIFCYSIMLLSVFGHGGGTRHNLAGMGAGFGGYRIIREVGRGGSAVVYQAQSPEGDQCPPVALKVLAESHRTALWRTRLDREFEFASELNHPGIVRMYRHGPFWLAMQFLGGGPLTRLRATGDRLAALAQVAAALDYAHHRGIVHGDVKPTNILLPHNFPRSGAVLTDFGSAHAVVDDVNRCQPNPEVSLPYTAPEILLGKAPSAATDEYALACTAVELFTGSPPFVADDAAELVDAHLRHLPPALPGTFGAATRGVDLVVERAMAKYPARRYDSCTEFVAELSRALDHPVSPET